MEQYLCHHDNAIAGRSQPETSAKVRITRSASALLRNSSPIMAQAIKLQLSWTVRQINKKKEPAMKLENRTILITGGSSGMGLALAKRLLERRNVVFITGRSQEKLESAKQALPAVHTFKSERV
jgi:NADPH:quinone reductase-like Zn-dependent oxidoreductase